ncbi:hypothetical protein N9249_00940, partial [bacterium]|nr:hypothetical protein [bacterium]
MRVVVFSTKRLRTKNFPKSSENDQRSLSPRARIQDTFSFLRPLKFRVFPPTATVKGWTTDFEAAKAQAKKEGKSLLL